MRSKQDHSRERSLRRNQTEAEKFLWQHLRDRRLLGFKFRRQHRIANYFPDFVCLSALLIVELDGSQHVDQTKYDAVRTKTLESLGYRVLRFWNDDVFINTALVLNTIALDLQAFRATAPSPGAARHPLPEDRGERVHCGDFSQ